MANQIPQELQSLLERSNRVSIVLNQRLLLRTEFEQNIRYSFDGGTFVVTEGFHAYVQFIEQENDEYVFLDENHIPILVPDVSEFLEEISELRTQALFQYYQAYKEKITGSTDQS